MRNVYRDLLCGERRSVMIVLLMLGTNFFTSIISLFSDLSSILTVCNIFSHDRELCERTKILIMMMIKLKLMDGARFCYLMIARMFVNENIFPLSLPGYDRDG